MIPDSFFTHCSSSRTIHQSFETTCKNFELLDIGITISDLNQNKKEWAFHNVGGSGRNDVPSSHEAVPPCNQMNLHSIANQITWEKVQIEGGGEGIRSVECGVSRLQGGGKIELSRFGEDGNREGHRHSHGHGHQPILGSSGSRVCHIRPILSAELAICHVTMTLASTRYLFFCSFIYHAHTRAVGGVPLHN